MHLPALKRADVCGSSRCSALTSGSSMSKRKASKYEGLVPDHFKELVRSALQKPNVAAQRNKPSSPPAEIEAASLQHASRAACAPSFSPEVASFKPPSLPQISSSSFYKTKEQAFSPSHGGVARAAASSPQQASSACQIAAAEPAYMRLIQLYKKRCSLFGAERRQLCFQMFAKLKEAMEYASQKTNCHVFAQEGASRPLASPPIASMRACHLIPHATHCSQRQRLPPLLRVQGCKSPYTSPPIPQFFTNLLLQLDEFVSRLKETKLGHRHFYEVHSVFAIPSSILRGRRAGHTPRQRMSRLHGH